MASKNNSKKPRSIKYLLFSWPDSEMAYIYMWYICICIIYILHFILYMCKISIHLKSVIILFSSSKLCTCITWDGFCDIKCFQNLLHPHPSLPFDNICNFWLGQTYFPGIRFKRIYIRNTLSGPFGTTRNKEQDWKGIKKRTKFQGIIPPKYKKLFQFCQMVNYYKNVISPVSARHPTTLKNVFKQPKYVQSPFP